MVPQAGRQESLRSQSVTLNEFGMRSQIVTASEGNDLSNEKPLQVDQIGSMIRTVRGQKVILDFDMARIYGVPTFRFNEAVKRNRDRFPSDFLFQLTVAETESLRSQSVAMARAGNPSQIAMGSQKHRDPPRRRIGFHVEPEDKPGSKAKKKT